MNKTQKDVIVKTLEMINSLKPRPKYIIETEYKKRDHSWTVSVWENEWKTKDDPDYLSEPVKGHSVHDPRFLISLGHEVSMGCYLRGGYVGKDEDFANPSVEIY